MFWTITGVKALITLSLFGNSSLDISFHATSTSSSLPPYLPPIVVAFIIHLTCFEEIPMAKSLNMPDFFLPDSHSFCRLRFSDHQVHLKCTRYNLRCHMLTSWMQICSHSHSRFTKLKQKKSSFIYPGHNSIFNFPDSQSHIFIVHESSQRSESPIVIQMQTLQ